MCFNKMFFFYTQVFEINVNDLNFSVFIFTLKIFIIAQIIPFAQRFVELIKNKNTFSL